MMATDKVLQLHAGKLQVCLGKDGHVVSLISDIDGKDYCHPAHQCHLISVRFVGTKKRFFPFQIIPKRTGRSIWRLTFKFADSFNIVLDAKETLKYMVLRVVKINHPERLKCLHWGPISTSMEGPLGEYLGLLRDGSFVIGMQGLAMNIDGSGEGHFQCAHWFPQKEGGSFLELENPDWSKDGEFECFGVTVNSNGDPAAGILNSGIVLYGCRENEVLDIVETVEKKESLPHPVINGKWIKRSKEGSRSSWWMDYTEENIDRCLDLVAESGFKWLCRFRTFGNWGHFDPDPNLYPNGWAGFKACSDKAEKRGVHTLFYTLSTFLKEINLPEPYISPIPDRRLQTVPPATALSETIGSDDETIKINNTKHLLKALEKQQMDVREKVLRIDDELISYDEVRQTGKFIELKGCKRGFYRTRPAKHEAGTKVARMLFTYWNNFFPGTEEMNAEVGRTIGRLALNGNFRQVTLDGHEGCMFTGHGAYSQNVFLNAVYQQTKRKGFLYTGSCLGNWSWHALSYISWGEYDCHKGFRGGMLDYRLWRMIQMKNNYMPRRLGQHYPDKNTTVEDIEWLMALAAGWDAGVELHVSIDDFNQNPYRNEILKKIRLWEEARLAGAFTEEQKMQFRQTDRLYTISKKAGRWKVDFVRRWQNKSLKILPSSFVHIKAKSGGAVKPCSISYDWTHDPGIYESAWLSDDMVYNGKSNAAVWEFTPPECDHGERVCWDTQKLQFVLRVPADALGSIKNPCVTINGDPEISVKIPVVLKPGFYISTPHDIPMAFMYGNRHNVVAEIPIRDLPALPKGKVMLEFSCEAMGKGICAILNVRTHKHIPLKK